MIKTDSGRTEVPIREKLDNFVFSSPLLELSRPAAKYLEGKAGAKNVIFRANSNLFYVRIHFAGQKRSIAGYHLNSPDALMSACRIADAFTFYFWHRRKFQGGFSEA